MENWTYAAGYQSIDNSWVPSSEPGTYEKAQIDLGVMMRRHEDEDWLSTPSIVKQSPVHPGWQPVHDHAAELLAETLMDMRYDFARHGTSIMQGRDLAQIFHKLSKLVSNKLPQTNEEYDS